MENINHDASITSIIMLPGSEKTALAAIADVVSRVGAPYNVIAAAFKHNLDIVLSSATLPFEFGVANARRVLLQGFEIAERIRAIDLPNKTEEERNRIARDIAINRLHELTQSEDGSARLGHEVMSFLGQVFAEAVLKESAQHLLEQGVVSVWSAFEILCRDFLECYLNGNPAQLLQLEKNEQKQFGVDRIPLPILARHDFDLSEGMGSLMVQNYNFSSLRVIISLYRAIFPTANDVHAALKRPELRVLYKRRNLLVHRRGIIDQRYLDETGETGQIGAKLLIRPDELRGMLITVAAIGEKILNLSLTTSK